MHWHYVRDGELTDMLPFLNTADAFVNGGLAFDLPVLKHCLAGRLPSPEQLSETSLDAYMRALESERILQASAAPPEDFEAQIPGDSHIREFIGGLQLHIPHQT
ncbi:MAG: hypothetical protein HY815_07435 [Candidatus Riflebacteria bacterium]|nr:hypothetical protein [Candidatus Riflebacteria bacterium]